MNPVQWGYLAPAIMIPVTLYAAVLLSSWFMRDRIGNATVKYTMDHLPMGIAFYREDGLILLANEAMHALSQALMHQRLMNGRDFHAFLLSAPVPASFSAGRPFPPGFPGAEFPAAGFPAGEPAASPRSHRSKRAFITVDFPALV